MSDPIHQVLAGDPGVWSSVLGERAAAYLRSEAVALDTARAAVEHVADAVLVTGELAAIRGALGHVPTLARALDAIATRGEPYATMGVRLPDLLLYLVTAGRGRAAARVLAEHEAPGEGRLLLVLFGDGLVCLKMVTFDDEEADGLPGGSVGKGGDA